MVLVGAAVNATQWLIAHPKAVCAVVAAPAAVALSPVALAAAGFGAGGVVVGMLPPMAFSFSSQT